MKQATHSPLTGCPVELTLSILGGKWKGIIIFHLMLSDTLRYGELQKRLRGVTPRMLTKQLRELEQDGVVHREVYPQVPPKVEYSLTEFGRTLTPIIEQMATWGSQYIVEVKPDESGEPASSTRIKQLARGTRALQDPEAGCEMQEQQKAS